MSPRLRRALRAASRRPDLDPSEHPGELNIVPFLDVVVNLMLFLLATSAATMALAQVEVEPPASCQRCPGVRRGLDLSVTLASSGISVAGRGGRLAPGCEELTSGPGVTIAARPEGYDFSALRACAARVHAAYPEEDSVILTADPHVPYADVIAAMDALRGSAGAELFPRVRLSAGLR
jgi:biopolymer transport protein TolR